MYINKWHGPAGAERRPESPCGFRVVLFLKHTQGRETQAWRRARHQTSRNSAFVSETHRSRGDFFQGFGLSPRAGLRHRAATVHRTRMQLSDVSPKTVEASLMLGVPLLAEQDQQRGMTSSSSISSQLSDDASERIGIRQKKRRGSQDRRNRKQYHSWSPEQTERIGWSPKKRQVVKDLYQASKEAFGKAAADAAAAAASAASDSSGSVRSLFCVCIPWSVYERIAWCWTAPDAGEE